MAKKEPRVNKKKEELVRIEKQKQEVKRLRTRVREDLYPFLVNKDMSVHDIHQLCFMMSQFIRQGFIGLQKTMKLEELKMEEIFKDEAFKDHMALYDMFRHETVMDAIQLLEGISKQIDDVTRVETKNRKFNELDLLLYKENE